jgi:hypothetical protein
VPLPFASARLKLQRAANLLDELDGIVIPFLAEAAQFTPGDTLGDIKLEVKPVPDMISAVAGDIIHNTRSSLDHLAVALVGLNGKNTKGVHFPFADVKENLKSTMKDKKFNRASTHAQDLLLSLEPLPVRATALHALHLLDLSDKHSGILLALPQFEMTVTKFPQHDAMLESEIPEQHGAFVLGEGQDKLGYRVKITSVVHVGIVIAQNEPLGGSELIPTLRSLHQLVTGIVERFARLYPA